MQRREFGKALIGGAIGAGLGSLTESGAALGQPQKHLTPEKNTKMHVGADSDGMEGPTLTSLQNLNYNLRFGVKSISPDPDEEAHRGKRWGGRIYSGRGTAGRGFRYGFVAANEG